MTLDTRSRHTDPHTSRLAGRSTNLTASQNEVIELYRKFGSMADYALVDVAQKRGTRFAESRIRSARSELVESQRVVQVGETVTPRGRACIVWGLA